MTKVLNLLCGLKSSLQTSLITTIVTADLQPKLIDLRVRVKFGRWARDSVKQDSVKQGSVKQGSVRDLEQEWIGRIF